MPKQTDIKWEIIYEDNRSYSEITVYSSLCDGNQKMNRSENNIRFSRQPAHTLQIRFSQTTGYFGEH